MSDEPKEEKSLLPSAESFPKEGPTRMTEEEIKAFVLDFLGNRIYSTVHSGNTFDSFLCVQLGVFANAPAEYIEKIGIIYEYLDKAGPVVANGQPMFMSHRTMHADDWKIARDTIARELEHRAKMELAK